MNLFKRKIKFSKEFTEIENNNQCTEDKTNYLDYFVRATVNKSDLCLTDIEYRTDGAIEGVTHERDNLSSNNLRDRAKAYLNSLER